MNPLRLPSRLLASFFLIVAALLPLRFAAGQQLPNTTRLLRFPTTNGDQIVFCYSGQLYTVPKTGGVARRLTSGPGYTSFSHFSPDGKELAFTSQYDGNTEVYVMPGGRWRTEAPDHNRDAWRATTFPIEWGRTTSSWAGRTPNRWSSFAPGCTSFNSFIGDTLHRGHWTRNCRNNCRSRAAALLLLAGRFEDGVQPRLPRIPHLETLPRRHGRRRLDLRLQDSTTENLTNDPAQDICPMWGADNRDLFPLRSRRTDESLLDRPRDQGNETADAASRIMTSSFPRSGRTRSFSKRLVTSGATTWPSGQGGPGSDRDQGGLRLRSGRLYRCIEAYRVGQIWRRTASVQSSSHAATFFPCRPRMARRAT